jgi:hypothetical protein
MFEPNPTNCTIEQIEIPTEDISIKSAKTASRSIKEYNSITRATPKFSRQ